MTVHPPLVLRAGESFDDVVEAIVDRHAGGTAVAAVERRPWIYASTFALDEVTVSLADGERMSMLVKDLGRWAALHERAPERPDAYADPRRELDVYASVLAPLALDTPLCYAVVDAPGSHSLFLEKVEGVELYQVGEIERWEAAAGWLARFHGSAAGSADQRAMLPASLLAYDAAFFRTWVERAEVLAAGHPPAVSTLGAVRRRVDELVGRLGAAPTTLVHGQFYASNVLVQDGRHGTRVRTVDWETAGVGPAVLDLSALVCGWDAAGRQRLVDAYARAAGAGNGDDLPELVTVAGLALAVQWLGWVPAWEPPTHHARDWLEEARGAMERLGW